MPMAPLIWYRKMYNDVRMKRITVKVGNTNIRLLFSFRIILQFEGFHSFLFLCCLSLAFLPHNFQWQTASMYACNAQCPMNTDIIRERNENKNEEKKCSYNVHNVHTQPPIWNGKNRIYWKKFDQIGLFDSKIVVVHSHNLILVWSF